MASHSPCGWVSTPGQWWCEMGSGGRHEHLALGETPNIAARARSSGMPQHRGDQRVTAQLVQRGLRPGRSSGPRRSRASLQPMGVWRSWASLRRCKSHNAGAEDAKPLVGRGEEVGLMCGAGAK